MSVRSFARTAGIILGSIALFAGGGFLGHKVVAQLASSEIAFKMQSSEILQGTAMVLDNGSTVTLHGSNSTKTGYASACTTAIPDDATFTAQFVDVAIPESLQINGTATITVHLQNTGTATWFNDNSNCASSVPFLHLGTTNDKDHTSLLFLENSEGWLNPERIQMQELAVAPGSTGTFIFTAQLPDHDDFVREFFSPVVEGDGFGQWLDDATFTVDLTVGNPDANLLSLAKFYQKAGVASVLTGDKEIDVDLSEQKMVVKVGDIILMEYKISSGKAATPTPTGNYKILFKDELRVSGQGIPYIMPNYMGFASGGAYGIHALPSLSYDNGYFWTEAYNHIGIPVSHGCIRVLPDNAKMLYSFADVGTKVTVHQ